MSNAKYCPEHDTHMVRGIGRADYCEECERRRPKPMPRYRYRCVGCCELFISEIPQSKPRCKDCK